MPRKPPPASGDQPPTHPDVLLVSAVAQRLGLSEEIVERHLAEGLLPGRKFGSEWRVYWPAVVDAFEHDPASDVLRPSSVAARLGLTEQTVRSLLAQRVLPGRKLGKQWLIYWPAVVATLRYADEPGQPVDHDSPEEGNSDTGG